MLNMIKMDVFRTVKTKSLYVIYVIMFAFIVMTTMIIAGEMDGSIENYVQDTKQQDNGDDSGFSTFLDGVEEGMETEDDQESLEETQTIGIAVDVPTEEGQKVTVFDMVFANLQAEVIATFLVIFAVLFATADLNSGYIKNFAGQVRNRWKLVVSKAIVLFGITVLTMLLFVLMQIVSNYTVFGYIEMGNISDMFSYLGIETILHYGLACICMSFAIIFRNNIISMILSICICFGVMNLLYGFVDNMLAKIGIENFETVKYTVSGRIGMISMNPTGGDIGKGILIAVMFILVFVGTSSFVFEKRDI